MNRLALGIAMALLALVAGVGFWLYQERSDPQEAATETGVEPDLGGDMDAPVETWTAQLYYPGSSGWLHAEAREVPLSDEVIVNISNAVAALLAGPQGTSLRPPLPDGVGLRKVYLGAESTVYLDLETTDGSPPPATGSSREMLTIYSLVNTVLLNFEELDRLVLLWNGRQLSTFAGHLDTRRPLVANLDLIAQSS